MFQNFNFPLKVLLLGGLKCGKSSYALKIGNSLKVKNKIYIATSQPFDEEMRKKIERHKKERGDQWKTVESHLDLATSLMKFENEQDTAVVIDCFTMWVNNMLFFDWSDDKIFKAFEKVLDVIKRAKCHIIGVSNEVGLGVIPDNKLTRRYVNLLGEFNQRCASVFSDVLFMIAGLPVKVK